MKSRVITMGLCAIALGSVASSGGSVSTKFENFLQKERKLEINVSELPMNISKALTENYDSAEWVKAYKWLNQMGVVIGYEVVIKRDSREQAVKFGQNGEPEK